MAIASLSNVAVADESKQGSVEIRLVDQVGEPVMGATVQLMLPGAGKPVVGADVILTLVDGDEPGDDGKKAPTDGAVVFAADSFSGAIKNEGGFEVSVYSKGFEDFSGDFKYLTNVENKLTIKLKPGGDAEIPQLKPGDISISINNIENLPIPGAIVKAYFPGANGSLEKFPNIVFEMTEGDKKYDADGRANGVFHLSKSVFWDYVKDGQHFSVKVETKGSEHQEGPMIYGEKHVNKIAIQTK